MAIFTKARIRCALFPSSDDPFTNVFTGAAPKIKKGAGVDFEFAFFNTADELFDVSNITDVTLMVKAADNPTSSPEILKTVSTGIQNISLEEWSEGMKASVTIPLLGSETAIAAGDHDITIWGHTNDAVSDSDVFGTARLKVVDVGLTGVTQPVISPVYATVEQLQAMLAGYVQFILPAGKTLTFQSPDGLSKRIIGVGNSAVRQDDLEQ